MPRRRRSKGSSGIKSRKRSRLKEQRRENVRMMQGLEELAAMTDDEAREYVRRSLLSGE